MRIEPQSRAVPGQIQGPAATGHQARQVTLHVEAMPDGRLRVSTPSARGWAVVVRSRDELARAVTTAFTEAQVAAYARWRAERYDLDHLTEPMAGDPMAPPRRPGRRPTNTGLTGWGRNQIRPDAHPPEEWTKLPDGRWQSPAGKAYGPATKMAQQVMARRRNAGLPT